MQIDQPFADSIFVASRRLIRNLLREHHLRPILAHTATDTLQVRQFLGRGVPVKFLERVGLFHDSNLLRAWTLDLRLWIFLHHVARLATKLRDRHFLLCQCSI